MFGVWAAPGAPETLAKGGGEAPPTQRNGLRGPRGRPDPQNDRFPILIKIENSSPIGPLEGRIGPFIRARLRRASKSLFIASGIWLAVSPSGGKGPIADQLRKRPPGYSSKWWPFGKEFYIENKRFDRDTLRVPSRSPTPTSKANGFRGPFDHIWGARGLHFRPIFGGSRGPGRPKAYMFFSPLKRPPRFC